MKVDRLAAQRYVLAMLAISGCDKDASGAVILPPRNGCDDGQVMLGDVAEPTGKFRADLHNFARPSHLYLEAAHGSDFVRFDWSTGPGDNRHWVLVPDSASLKLGGAEVVVCAAEELRVQEENGKIRRGTFALLVDPDAGGCDAAERLDGCFDLGSVGSAETAGVDTDG